MWQNQGKILSIKELGHRSDEPLRVECAGLKSTSAAFYLAQACQDLARPILVVTKNLRAAESFASDLRFLGLEARGPLLEFPPYNLLPYKALDYHNETAAKRIRVLCRLLEGEKAPLVVTTVDALLKKIVPKKNIRHFLELIMPNEEVEREHLLRRLISGGYSRVHIVEEPGDFCIRGGILDLFCPLYDDPLRVEFFDDYVDSIRLFSIDNQRTVRELQEAVIAPASEVVIRPSQMAELIMQFRLQASEQELSVTATRRLVATLKAEGRFSGIDGLLPLVYPELDTLMDYLPVNTMVVRLEPADLEEAADEIFEKARQNYETAREDDRLCVTPEMLFQSWPVFLNELQSRDLMDIRTLSVRSATETEVPACTRFDFRVLDVAPFSIDHGAAAAKTTSFAPAAKWIQRQLEQGISVGIICHNRNQIDRVVSVLEPYGVVPATARPLAFKPMPAPGVIVVEGQISEGFVWPDVQWALITDLELFGSRRRPSRPAVSKSRQELLDLEDIGQGDLVVHQDHGIGRYTGLTKIRLEGSENDFLKIHYRGDDRLYLPVDRLNVIQKYMGVDDIEPVLDKMGGKSWEKVKARIRRSAEKIAGELLKLYASRKVRKGIAFRPVDEYMLEFEGGFAFNETPDQLKAIEDVLSDMTATVPMDRLICGDVGYGKTEVALRAGFVAVFNGKQVAVLVPTTVLAEQHYETFLQRFKRFGVQIECLSRFRSAKEQRHIISQLGQGRVDIIIGTHRLLQKDVQFKDLGLFIIDEEQRFGVRHKEKLKKLRGTVDVLTLTATPIPRTLHMSLTGVRDISIISTPPEYRRSIITYVSEYNDRLVKEAVERELDRGGQVYFVHNQIASIQRMAAKLLEICPAARIGVAHGRMEESELEAVMMDFHSRKINLLVTTTIIESGLDIPAANTILVNRADRFGLSQMYQLRGRVGRSEDQAYAFLFIPKESHLSKDARKRLKVLMEHSDLGSGFQIAMNDLKIRGGGTILGASQSGHIAAVGYDMFLKLMEEAVADLKGEPIVEELDPEINIANSAFIPEDYIPDIDQRLSMYRRLSRMQNTEALAEIKSELIDRFGPLPSSVSNLLVKIMLKIGATAAGIQRLDFKDGTLTLMPADSRVPDARKLVTLALDQPRRYRLSPDRSLQIKLHPQELKKPFKSIKKILREIGGYVNN
jgi:transcription-repair coupling factor (superfamily II helicase)